MRIEPIGRFDDLSVSMHGGGQLGRDKLKGVFGVSELVLNGLEHPIAPCGVRRDDGVVGRQDFREGTVVSNDVLDEFGRRASVPLVIEVRIRQDSGGS